MMVFEASFDLKLFVWAARDKEAKSRWNLQLCIMFSPFYGKNLTHTQAHSVIFEGKNEFLRNVNVKV